MHKKSDKIKGLQAFSAESKAKYVTWCRQFGSIIQTQRNYCLEYAESPTTQNSTLRWVQKYN